MITRLRAENFKSWKDTGDLRFAPLTGLFGANSSGKSSILQALLVFKQTVESPDPAVVLNLGDEKALVDLGAFVDVIHNHDASLSLAFFVSWVDQFGDASLAATFYADDGGLHAREIVRQSPGSITRVTEEGHGYALTFNDGPKAGIPFPWYPRPLGPVMWSLALARYLGPLRQRPRRGPYVWGGNRPSDVGPEGGDFAQALLAQSADTNLVRKVAESLKRMNLAESFDLTPIAPGRREHEIRLKLTADSAYVLLSDVGFGVSQVLPVLVQCYLAPPGSTLIIEQPELHLHPAAQSELADVLIDVVQNRKIQIIIESHSEHLLRRIQRRIAEGSFAANDASLYFCEMRDGESKARELELTDDGFIKNWPKDFFGDEMADLTAMTEAAAKRHLAAK